MKMIFFVMFSSCRVECRVTLNSFLCLRIKEGKLFLKHNSISRSVGMGQVWFFKKGVHKVMKLGNHHFGRSFT